jgi:hypothetical protein
MRARIDPALDIAPAASSTETAARPRWSNTCAAASSCSFQR